MGFFDLKLIIIIALTIICYFIYKELLHINKKLNYTYSRLINLENDFHIKNGEIPINIEKELNDLDKQPNQHFNIINNLSNQLFNNLDKQPKNLDKQALNLNTQAPNLDKQSTNLNTQALNLDKQAHNLDKQLTNLNTQHELKILNDEYMSIQHELYNLPRDISEDLNYVFNQISMVPLHIPFNFKVCPFSKSNKKSIESNEENNETSENSNTYILESKQVEPLVESTQLEPLVESTQVESLVESKQVESLVESTQLEPLVESTQLEPLVESTQLEPLVESFVEQCLDKTLDNDTYSSETSENKVTTPLEEFSNDDNELTTSIINSKIQFNETKLENVLKNLNKYKLPELQDLAIEYRLGVQFNGKNKNKNQLLNEIKNYILNKNI